MRRFRIGSAFGIPIQLDLTFLLVLPLFAWIISTQVEQWVTTFNEVAGASLDLATLTADPVPWILGAVAAVGLFAGVVLHELGHSLVARHYGYPIDSITLWLFGGIAQLSELPEDWKQELQIAVAGPIVSVLLGVLAYAAFLVVSPGGLVVESVRFVLSYLAVMNFVLAAFNLLPGFPMDGGRVLRALLARRRPYARATKIAAEVGKGFAILLGLFGLFPPFNVFLIGLAFFIYIGAEGESRQTVMKAAFEGVTVGDVMTPAEEVETVSPDLSVRDLIDRMFEERHTGYPVEQNGEIVGLVALEDARQVREVERDAYTVEEVMTGDLYSVAPDEDVMTALQALDGNDVGRLLVFDGDEFVGLLTRTDIMTALTIITSSTGTGQDVTEDGSTALRPQS